MIAAPTIDGPACGCDAQPGDASLICLDDALAIIADRTQPVASRVTLPLSQASGRILAFPVTARVATLAACDGLIRHPADMSEAPSGSLLDFIPFDDT